MTKRAEARLRFSQMRMLLELAQHQSVRRAAEALHLSQSAVSKSLLEMESALNIALFRRTGRGLTITEAGEMAARHARLILSDLEQMQGDLQATVAGQDRVFRLGVVPFLSHAFLPEVLKKFSVECPMRIQHHEGRTPRLMRLLSEGQVDAILTTYTGDTVIALPPPEFSHVKLFCEDVVVFVARDHPLAGRTQIDWPELLNERWVLPASPSLLRDMLDAHLSFRALPPLTPAIESSNIVACVEFVCRRLGVGVGPRSVLVQALEHERVVVLPTQSSYQANVGLFVRTAMMASPEVRALRKVASGLSASS